VHRGDGGGLDKRVNGAPAPEERRRRRANACPLHRAGALIKLARSLERGGYWLP
jgi:hypothetical protein